MAADICRLCLRPIDKAKSIDLVAETTKFAMLKEFLPEMNLDITENTQVCSNCMQELEVSYNFKQSVVVNEANIQTKLEENKLKKIDLKLMLDDVAKKELKEDDYVCRTCLLICRTPSISLFDTPSNMMPCSFVKKMCQLVFELEFIASDKPVLCDECWETLQTVYNFRKCCLKSDKKLRTYVAKKNLKKLGVEEFKKFVEENPPIDNDEVSSDDELDGYIKEEPIDEEELKFDPEEASCSSASLKFKEETTVKSESDEDMEDEPELLDPKALKSETSELDGEDCKLEIGDVKVDAEGEGPSGNCIVPANSNQIVYKFKCATCLYQTNRKNRYTDHLLVHATPDDIPMFHCANCSYQSKRKRGLMKHLRNVHRPAIDRKSAPSSVTVPGFKFKCAECLYQTNRKNRFTDHLLVHASPDQISMFQCTACSYKTKRKRGLMKHLRSMHPPVDSVSSFECNECSYVTKCNRSMSDHVLKKHRMTGKVPIFSCAHCSYQTNIRYRFTDHLFVHASPDEIPMFQCTECSYRGKKRRYLIRHLLDVHAPKEKEAKFECNECVHITKTKRGMASHLLKKHSQLGTDTELYCTECSYNTKDENALSMHKLIHTIPNTVFTCSVCSYKTPTMGNLNRHKLKHADSTFSCLECTYKTLIEENFTKHRLKHAEVPTI